MASQVNNTEQQYQLDLFKERLKKREIWINREINESIIEYLYMSLLKLQEESQTDPITVVINSPGGYMFESIVATDMMGTMQNHCKTIALANACSGAFSIFMAGQERICHDYTCLMMHDTTTGMRDKRSSIKEYVEYLEHIQYKKALFFSLQTKGKTTVDYWMELFNSGKEKWFSVEEALELNIVHKVVRRKEMVDPTLVIRKPYTWDLRDWNRAQQ